MSSTSASATSSSSSASSGKTYGLFNSSTQTSSVKLDRTNYLMWEATVMPLIIGNCLLSHINGTSPAPPLTVLEEGFLNRRSPPSVANDCIIPFPAIANEQSGAPFVQSPPCSSSENDTTASSDSSSARKTTASSSSPFRSSNGENSNSPSQIFSESRAAHGDEHVLGQNDHQSNSESNVGPSHQTNTPAQSSPSPPQHTMVTRSRVGVFKPKLPYIGLADATSGSDTQKSSSPVPKNVAEAMSLPSWKQAMIEEFSAMQKNGTWWGFQNSKSDTSLFYFKNPKLTVFVLVYVDDILVTGSDPKFLANFTQRLNSVFALKDLGPLYYFLGIEVKRDESGIYLNQGKYAEDVLKRFSMMNCASVTTPMVTGRKFTAQEGEKMHDPSLFRKAIGSLQYLITTRLDIAFSVNKLSQFLADPTETHYQGVKRILRYVKGTQHLSSTIVPSCAF
ncbi:Copia protein [Senna tora]|uniref:Copia protein n=1 Tax=Senna tora TaxID=362788 RepID=A0A834TFE5_9FABA|nr:Copia protein [Senna tora]